MMSSSSLATLLPESVGLLAWSEFIGSLRDAIFPQQRSSTGTASSTATARTSSTSDARSSGGSGLQRSSTSTTKSDSGRRVSLALPFAKLSEFFDEARDASCASLPCESQLIGNSFADVGEAVERKPWTDMPSAALRASALTNLILLLRLSAAASLPLPDVSKIATTVGSCVPESTTPKEAKQTLGQLLTSMLGTAEPADDRSTDAVLSENQLQQIAAARPEQNNTARAIGLHLAALVAAVSVRVQLALLAAREDSDPDDLASASSAPGAASSADDGAWITTALADCFASHTGAKKTRRAAWRLLEQHVDVCLQTRLVPYFATTLRQSYVTASDVFGSDVIESWPAVRDGMAPLAAKHDSVDANEGTSSRTLRRVVKALAKAGCFVDPSDKHGAPLLPPMISAVAVKPRESAKRSVESRPSPTDTLAAKLPPKAETTSASTTRAPVNSAGLPPPQVSGAATKPGNFQPRQPGFIAGNAPASMTSVPTNTALPQRNRVQSQHAPKPLTASAVASRQHGFLVSRPPNAYVTSALLKGAGRQNASPAASPTFSTGGPEPASAGSSPTMQSVAAAFPPPSTAARVPSGRILVGRSPSPPRRS